MLVLFETPAGYSLFKVNKAKKFESTEPDDIYDTMFPTSKKALSSLQLVNFQPFADTADALNATTSCCLDGKVTKSLKKFLKHNLNDDSLAVADKALAVSLKESLGDDTQILHNAKTQELFRGLRSYISDYLLQDDSNNLSSRDLHHMQLGLSHSLSRYKLKFSADKVDTMVIQAVGLLDELDKEINTYAMRVKEWYGWHFPELQQLVGDNRQYAKLVLKCGFRNNYTDDLSDILEDETVEKAVKDAAQISMGTEVADLDILHIQSLAEQVLSLTEYRAQLFEYLKNRMTAIAPNLTILVGELVGARLISHAGSLLNLAKQPASTVQILGAEKALFRALKTKHDTPKYGLIYHASLIGQAAPKHKGKISRVLAAKTALAIRVDALTEDDTLDTTIGYEGRAKVEARLRQLEGGSVATMVTPGRTNKYDPVATKQAAAATPSYNDASDMVLDTTTTTPEPTSTEKKKKKDKKDKSSKKKKRKAEEEAEDEDAAAKKAAKKAKKAKKEKRKSKD